MQRQGMKSRNVMVALIVVAVVIGVIIYPNLAAQKISEVKTEENIGKTVTVKGEVKTVIKIGQLSGYTLEDESGTIAVSSQELPKEGETITVKGTLIKDTLLGYYIKVN